MRNLKLYILPILLCFSSGPILAELDLDSIRNSKKVRAVPFVGFGTEMVQMADRTILQKGFIAGITINEKVNLGVFSNWNCDALTFEKFGLPDLRMKYIQGGVLTSYDQRISKLLSLNIGTRVGQASARLQSAGDRFDIIKQRVVVMHPDIGLEVSPFDFAKIKFNIGYRLMTDLKITEVLQTESSGLSYGLNVKFDIFRKKFRYHNRSYTYSYTP
ncbi:MAG: hypothetical protein JXQ96_11605 [Cyclobacteriaceae bacterium]